MKKTLIQHKHKSLACLAAICVLLIFPNTALADISDSLRIVYPKKSSYEERLAAKEVRRYLYLRTNSYVPIVHSQKASTQSDLILIAGKDKVLSEDSLKDNPKLKRIINSLRPQQFLLRTVAAPDSKKLLIVGGDDSGTLYGAYRFIEHLGVRFFLHGDVVPDERILLKLPKLDELGEPLFELRGLNPWGSHAEGMDLWGPQEYKAIFSQMVKMRMNFMGIHCYSEGRPFAEPLVWTGTEDDCDRTGSVKFAYPASYFNTLRGRYWGYKPKKTSDYSFGAHLLFERDDWGPEVMLGYCPWPANDAQCNDLFNRMGRTLCDSFTFANRLNIKTCIGTEAPLAIPTRLRNRLKTKGRDPNAPATIRELYKGMFQRIIRTHPLDYYWIWTNESWTWRGNTNDEVGHVISDIKTALNALKNVHAPFTLATAGWVLGPRDDRAAFDRLLPKEIALSAINRTVGHDPVDPAFQTIHDRQKWAIPWLEDDPAITSPQLWVGRTRKDAADAFAYRCTGFMGLHWRTRILAPNVAAFAQACWDQSIWNPSPGKFIPDTFTTPSLADGSLQGKTADYPGIQIANTDDDKLYQTCRYDTKGYHLKVPNGDYSITLKFCEPHFSSPAKRVWDVKIQNKTLIEKLDIFAEVGKFAALDYTFDNIEVTKGMIRIDFIYDVSLPCISAIVIKRIKPTPFVQKINCGGLKYKNYESDNFTPTPRTRGKPRGLTTEDFYTDWALTMFGSRIAKQAAAVFQRLDGNLPRTSSWVGGAGGIRPDNRPWPKVAAEFSFVDELEKLRYYVESPGCIERFDYWLNTFRYHRSQAKVRCVLAQFDETMKKAEAEKDHSRRRTFVEKSALPAYKDLIDAVAEAYRHQLSALTTYGGIATIINWEGHIGPTVTEATRERLEKALGHPLPGKFLPKKQYGGFARIIVPTARTNATASESPTLKIIILDNKKPKHATLYWRRLGSRQDYSAINLTHLARAVYSVSLPMLTQDIEYHIKVITADDKKLYFPATAPTMNQTVVVTKPG